MIAVLIVKSSSHNSESGARRKGKNWLPHLLFYLISCSGFLIFPLSLFSFRVLFRFDRGHSCGRVLCGRLPVARLVAWLVAVCVIGLGIALSNAMWGSEYDFRACINLEVLRPSLRTYELGAIPRVHRTYSPDSQAWLTGSCTVSLRCPRRLIGMISLPSQK